MMDYVKLSKTMAHALRHAPEQYGLTLDEHGWVSINDFLRGLNISFGDVKRVLGLPGKKRYETDFLNMKIRAFNGHSVKTKIEMTETKPPHVLYHGTNAASAMFILSTGLKPMSRQYVHLSEDLETAKKVGGRKGDDVRILRVYAKEAYLKGVKFYHCVDGIWCADEVPSEFIEMTGQ